MSSSEETAHEIRSQVPDLVRMANQIASNFAHHPPEQAVGEVAAHIRSFWTPSMRVELAEFVAADGHELNPLARSAIEQLNPS